MRIPQISEKKILWFGLPWIVYHWLIPFTGPLIRLLGLPLRPVIYTLLVIDSLCFVYFLLWMIRNANEGRRPLRGPN